MALKKVEYDFDDKDIESVITDSTQVNIMLTPNIPMVYLEKAELIVICKQMGLTVTDSEFP